MKEKISDVQIKSKQTLKISKFTLSLFAFVYQRIMNFPQTKFKSETLTTGNLFEYVHKINVKIHLLHSHVTRKIIKFAHDLCNLQVRENKDVIPCIVWCISLTGKENIEKLTVQFLINHEYFSQVFSKDEFFSTLKGKTVDNNCYENAKKLFILLKMRNFSDLNDLYNAQDVIILLKVIENRFQSVQDKMGYNPRIINSASRLSGCIQREQSKNILALPIHNAQMEVFEKNVMWRI